MADLIHQMTAGGCSPEGQCTYVHFLFTWPTKEVFTGLAWSVLVLASQSSGSTWPFYGPFENISATCKSILKNEEVIPIQLLQSDNSIIC